MSWIWVDPTTALTIEYGRSQTVPVLNVALNWPATSFPWLISRLLPWKKCHSPEIPVLWEAWAMVGRPWKMRLHVEREAMEPWDGRHMSEESNLEVDLAAPKTRRGHVGWWWITQLNPFRISDLWIASKRKWF